MVFLSIRAQRASAVDQNMARLVIPNLTELTRRELKQGVEMPCRSEICRLED